VSRAVPRSPASGRGALGEEGVRLAHRPGMVNVGALASHALSAPRPDRPLHPPRDDLLVDLVDLGLAQETARPVRLCCARDINGYAKGSRRRPRPVGRRCPPPGPRAGAAAARSAINRSALLPRPASLVIPDLALAVAGRLGATGSQAGEPPRPSGRPDNGQAVAGEAGVAAVLSLELAASDGHPRGR
jgi:hypothetical protein